VTALLAYLRVPLLRRSLLATLLFGTIFGAIELGLRRELAGEQSERDRTLSALQNEAAELRARIDAAATFEERSRQLQEVEARFRAPVDRSSVVETLTRLSAESGTRIIHGTNSFGRARGDIVPVEQDLSIEGPYLAITRFLAALSGLETLTLLRSAELAANADGSLVRVKLKLVTLSAADS
jgi:hypothetical protein